MSGPNTLDFLRGPITGDFYLCGVGPQPNGEVLTGWYFAMNLPVGQQLSTAVFLSSRPEDQSKALSFNLSQAVGGYSLTSKQGSTVLYLGIINSLQGFGTTSLGLTTKERALVFNITNTNNTTDIIAGSKYSMVTAQLVSSILGTDDAMTTHVQNIHYSTSSTGKYPIGTVNLGSTNFLNSLSFYFVPVTVYSTTTSLYASNGLTALFTYLAGENIVVFSNKNDADVGNLYSYCTGINPCGTSGCYGICVGGLICLNETTGMHCGSQASVAAPKQANSIVLIAMIAVLLVVVIIIVVFGISRQSKPELNVVGPRELI
jgi:hypothetical protein